MSYCEVVIDELRPAEQVSEPIKSSQLAPQKLLPLVIGNGVRAAQIVDRSHHPQALHGGGERQHLNSFSSPLGTKTESYLHIMAHRWFQPTGLFVLKIDSDVMLQCSRCERRHCCVEVKKSHTLIVFCAYSC